MAKPVLRIDLSKDAPDFRLLVIEAGLPLLDRWNTHGALLGNWLGRFAAESAWDGDSMRFYVRDDEGRRLGNVACEPATTADLRGALKKELGELRTQLQKVEPQSASAQAVYDLVSPGLLNPRPGSGGDGLNCQFFKYRDEQDRWKLLWCCGYKPAEGRELSQPAICNNPECRQLALVDKGSHRKCPRCEKGLFERGVSAKYGKRIGALLAIFLLVAACLLGAAGLYAYIRSSAVLTGRVLCAADQQPINAAKIRIEGKELEAESDAQGTFRIERARRGRATIRVFASGFQEQTIQAELASRQETSINVELVGAAKLTGKVVHTMGEDAMPIAKAQVAVEEIEQFKAETDDNGDFSLADLPPGPLTVNVSAEGFRTAQVAGNASVEGDPPLRVVLAGDGTIDGSVVYAVDESVPVADAEVGIEGLELRDSTDKQGRFTLSGVPPVPVNLQVSAKGFHEKREAAKPGGSSIRVLLTGGAILAGEVIRGDTDQPVPKAEIVLSGTPFTAQSDENGQFRVEGARSGPTKIQATAPGLAGEESVDLPPDQETSVEIVLTGTATVSGRVVSAIDQSPIADATVAIPDTQMKTTTDAKGQFTLSGLVPGTVVFSIAAEGYFPKEAKNDVAEGQRNLGEVALSPAPTLQGKVLSAAGKQPLQGAEVRIAPELKATTDEQGAFIISGIPVGPVTLHVSADAHCPAQVAKDLVPGSQTLDDVVLNPAVTLSGAVVRALDGEPVDGAEVAISGTEKKTRTDRKGAFTLSEIPTGPATIRITAPGFRPQELEYVLPPGTQKLDPVPLEGDTAVSGVTIDADNKQRAVPNAKIDVRVAGYQTTVDGAANGGFSVGNVPSGMVYVTARAEGYSDTQVQKSVSPDDAWIEVPMAHLINAKGVVVDAKNRKRAIAKAAVRVSVAGTVRNATSGTDGGFSVTVPAGEADVHATADGFCDANLTKRITAKDAWIEIPMEPGAPPLRGRVLDATKDATKIEQSAIPNASVTVEMGDDRWSTDTDSKGEFEVTGLPVGTATVDVSAPKFESEQLNHPTGSAVPLRVLLMPFFPPGTVRIVLTWAKRPRDLDGHLYGPLPNGSRFHVYFDLEHRDAGGVHLDVDAKEGFGPETITAKAIPGTYQYYVADSANLETSNGQELGRSGAQVRVYYKEAQSDQLHVIPVQIPVNARGPVWHAFDVEVGGGGQIKIAPKDPKAKDTWGSELPAPREKEKTQTSRT